MADIESVTTAVHLAVDAGGTSTRAVLVDGHGRCLAVGRAGAGNPVSAGWTTAAASVVAAAAEALAGAGLPAADVASVVVAMAGGSGGGGVRPATVLGDALAPLGVTAPVRLDADLLAQYFSGTPEPDGHGLVAGTGAAAIRVSGGALVRVVDGLGWLLGDDGSGFWIGREVVRHVLAALDGRGPATALTALLLAEALPDARQTSAPGVGRWWPG